MPMSKIKISNHNAKLYPICIVGAGLAGKSLAYLLTQKKRKFCLIEARPSSKAKSHYISTGFIQNKTLKLIKKFFTQSPPITNTINTLNLFGQYLPDNLQFTAKKPFGYMLDLDQFLQSLTIKPQKTFEQTYVKKIQINSNLINLTLNDNQQIHVKKLVIADGAISNTSQLLKKQGIKININKKFVQGAEAIVKINFHSQIDKNKLKHIQNVIFFGIFHEYKGYGMWIAPFGKYLKIGFGVNKNFVNKRNLNLNTLMQKTIKRAQQILYIKKLQILHVGYKLIPVITAAQLHNITPYKNIWQIGDAGGFVGPLLLDGIYPGLNSAVDTYLDLIKTNNQPTSTKSVAWAAKTPIPGNSIYTEKLLKYMTTSAILKEFYDLIFLNKITLFIASKFLQIFYKPFLYLFFKYKKELE